MDQALWVDDREPGLEESRIRALAASHVSAMRASYQSDLDNLYRSLAAGGALPAMEALTRAARGHIEAIRMLEEISQRILKDER